MVTGTETAANNQLQRDAWWAGRAREQLDLEESLLYEHQQNQKVAYWQLESRLQLEDRQQLQQVQEHQDYQFPMQHELVQNCHCTSQFISVAPKASSPFLTAPGNSGFSHTTDTEMAEAPQPNSAVPSHTPPSTPTMPETPAQGADPVSARELSKPRGVLRHPRSSGGKWVKYPHCTGGTPPKVSQEELWVKYFGEPSPAAEGTIIRAGTEKRERRRKKNKPRKSALKTEAATPGPANTETIEEQLFQALEKLKITTIASGSTPAGTPNQRPALTETAEGDLFKALQSLKISTSCKPSQAHCGLRGCNRGCSYATYSKTGLI